MRRFSHNVRICFYSSLIAIVFFVLPSNSFAQKRTVRLYIPISNTAEVVVENNEKKLIIKDYLNSTRGVIQDTAFEDQAYLPFGKKTSNDKNVSVNKQFTGHQLIENTDVYNAGARFYNSSTGFFIQPDSVEGPNRYAYVNGDPISYHDLDGNQGSPAFREFLGGMIKVARENTNEVTGRAIENAGKVVERVVNSIRVGAASLAKDPSIANSNQDAVFCHRCVIEQGKPDIGAYTVGVFDGMGGHVGGREAAITAKDILASAIYYGNAQDDIGAGSILKRSFGDANQAIAAKAYANGNLSGMGTTGTVAWVLPNGQVMIGHVGDSRVYGLNSKGNFVQMTLDDASWTRSLTESQSKALQGRLANITSRAQLGNDAMYWDTRNVIASAINGDAISPQIYTVGEKWGLERLLITSDGIHDNLTDREIYGILSRGSKPGDVSEELVNTADRVSRQGTIRSKRDDKSAAAIFFK